MAITVNVDDMPGPADAEKIQQALDKVVAEGGGMIVFPDRPRDPADLPRSETCRIVLPPRVALTDEEVVVRW